MNPAPMMRQIENAIADEQRTHKLRAIIVEVARQNGARPSPRELDEAVQFIIDYIKHVPVLFIAMHGASIQLGAEKSITPLLEAGERYWKEGHDIIPDHLGLLGLMDDAYYVLCILQYIAEQHRRPDGAPLMNFQLTGMNQTMRALIGEPHASVLDAEIGKAIAAPMLQQMLGNLPYFNQPLVDRHPMWGDASIDDIVKVQMGALGIV